MRFWTLWMRQQHPSSSHWSVGIISYDKIMSERPFTAISIQAWGTYDTSAIILCPLCHVFPIVEKRRIEGKEGKKMDAPRFVEWRSILSPRPGRCDARDRQKKSLSESWLTLQGFVWLFILTKSWKTPESRREKKINNLFHFKNVVVKEGNGVERPKHVAGQRGGGPPGRSRFNECRQKKIGIGIGLKDLEILQQWHAWRKREKGACWVLIHQSCCLVFSLLNTISLFLSPFFFSVYGSFSLGCFILRKSSD